MQPENKQTARDIEEASRWLDPIEAAAESYDDTLRVEQIDRDIERIDDILTTDNTLTPRETSELHQMGCDLRLEWLYAKHGGAKAEMTEFSARWDEADTFFRRAGERATERKAQYPQDFWDIALKHLDLRALQAHRNARESQTTLQGADAGEKVWALADSQMKGVVVDSTRLMGELLTHTESRDEPETAKDARGKLYEVLLISYARLEAYENEEFDTVFAHSALEREDKPWNDHAYPKRAFDIVVESDGSPKDLIQAKNHKNGDEYAEPIRKVEDTAYYKTLRNLPQFVKDFRLIASNPSDPKLRAAVDRAHERLEEVFGRQLDSKQEPVLV